MPFLSNRFIFTGLTICLLTVLTALSGSPAGYEEFRIPIWNILLQFNLCTGFVFVVLGVLDEVKISTPDLRRSLQLFVAAFVAYGMACVPSTGISFTIQLFLFTFAIACLLAGWALLGLSVLKQFDTDFQE